MTTHIHGVSTRLAVPGHSFVRATWIYRTTDPLAVTLAVLGERRRWPVEWKLSRQLLGASVLGPVGDGDVALCVDAGGLHIRLSSPDGEAELTGDSVVAWNLYLLVGRKRHRDSILRSRCTIVHCHGLRPRSGQLRPRCVTDRDIDNRPGA